MIRSSLRSRHGDDGQEYSLKERSTKKLNPILDLTSNPLLLSFPSFPHKHLEVIPTAVTLENQIVQIVQW
jgi:hypothetical protein